MENLRKATREFTDHIVRKYLSDPKELEFLNTALPFIAANGLGDGLNNEENEDFTNSKHPVQEVADLVEGYYRACWEYAHSQGISYSDDRFLALMYHVEDIGQEEINESIKTVKPEIQLSELLH